MAKFKNRDPRGAPVSTVEGGGYEWRNGRPWRAWTPNIVEGPTDEAGLQQNSPRMRTRYAVKVGHASRRRSLMDCPRSAAPSCWDPWASIASMSSPRPNSGIHRSRTVPMRLIEESRRSRDDAAAVKLSPHDRAGPNGAGRGSVVAGSGRPALCWKFLKVKRADPRPDRVRPCGARGRQARQAVRPAGHRL